MGCNFCVKKSVIFTRDIVDDVSFGWGDKKIDISDCIYSKFGLFIDRGYLRFVDLEDCDCLDHGNKIEIQFCPFCGNRLNKGE